MGDYNPDANLLLINLSLSANCDERILSAASTLILLSHGL
jgi:hypothetical protein